MQRTISLILWLVCATGAWTMTDSTGEALRVDERLLPELVIREGTPIAPTRRLLRESLQSYQPATAGSRFFQLAATFSYLLNFRDDEGGPWHRSEFTMLEWYRSFATLDAIAATLPSTNSFNCREAASKVSAR